MKRSPYTHITTNEVDSIFYNGSPFKKLFPRPRLAESICRQRAEGKELPEIAERVGHSTTYCSAIIRKTKRLYTLMEA